MGNTRFTSLLKLDDVTANTPTGTDLNHIDRTQRTLAALAALKTVGRLHGQTLNILLARRVHPKTIKANTKGKKT